jgi:DNA (cytosine-5)-methyltransferase 1
MTIDASPRYAIASTFLTKFYKTGIGQEVTEPLHTITTSPGHFGEVKILMLEKEEVRSEFREKCNQVAAFIIEYYGQGGAHSVDEPLHTIVTKDRFALVTVYGIDYIICDITLRMLNPRELYKAQGFPEDYIIDRDYTGKPYPVSKQVARCGNSVVPIMAQKLVEANCSYLKVGERMPNVSIDDTTYQLRFA